MPSRAQIMTQDQERKHSSQCCCFLRRLFTNSVTPHRLSVNGHRVKMWLAHCRTCSESQWTVLLGYMYTGCANKKQSPRKTPVFQQRCSMDFSQTFRVIYVSIFTTYPANFIDVVQRIQQFKVQSSLFQVNMQLHIEYSRVTNQTLHSFRQTFKGFNF